MTTHSVAVVRPLTSRCTAQSSRGMKLISSGLSGWVQGMWIIPIVSPWYSRRKFC